MKYSVISFDMFQTLVDVNARKYEVWSNILKEDYTKEKAERCWSETLKKSSEYTSNIKYGREEFQPMAITFAQCYERLFEELEITTYKESGVEILFQEHGKAVVYPDAIEFFENLNTDYRVWISSDTDRKMIEPLLQIFKYEYAFLSEDIQAYKINEKGEFFNYILNTTGVAPQKIIHVGDGLADIVGAKKSGITTCWINREGKEWSNPIKPDYTITNLMELNEILK